MPISSLNLPRLSGTSLQQVGTFSIDGNPEFTTTNTANIAANAALVMVADSSGLTSGAEIMTLPGAGVGGVTIQQPTMAVNQLGANQFNIPQPGVITAVPAGTTLSRWNRIGTTGQPRHVRITRNSNGDYYDWVEGMEPYSATTSIGGVVSVQLLVMLCQLGAIHLSPFGLFPAGAYSIVVDH